MVQCTRSNLGWFCVYCIEVRGEFGGVTDRFCPLNHLNGSRQSGEVFAFLSECLRTNRTLDVESSHLWVHVMFH